MVGERYTCADSERHDGGEKAHDEHETSPSQLWFRGLFRHRVCPFKDALLDPSRLFFEGRVRHSLPGGQGDQIGARWIIASLVAVMIWIPKS